MMNRNILDKLPPGSGVLAALSGGADSVALLLLLGDYVREERPDIVLAAAHLNHMLRGGESDRDEAFAREFCGKLGVRFFSESADVNGLKRQGESIETAARRIRYDFLLRTAHELGGYAVATAHNADDQAETVLFNLIRGSGMKGLSGIPSEREQDGIKIIRPLLETSRADIEAFLFRRGQDFVTDSTNLSSDYTRNRMRLEIMPLLSEINPRAKEHIAAAAHRLSDDEAYLEAEASKYVDVTRGAVGAAQIASLPSPIATRALRQLCGLYGIVPQRTHMAALLALAASGDPSGEVSLPGGYTASREYGRLIITRNITGDREPLSEQTLHLGDNVFGDYIITIAKAEGDTREKDLLYLEHSLLDRLQIRTRAEGDKISPAGRNWTKTVKKLFIDMKIPRRERERYPIITYGGRLCALHGIGVDKAYIPVSGDVISIAVRRKM